MSFISPDAVREHSGPLVNELHAKYYELLKNQGPAFAAVVLFDACSTVLGVALLPFNREARLDALELLRSEIDEQASDYRVQFDAFAEKRKGSAT